MPASIRQRAPELRGKEQNGEKISLRASFAGTVPEQSVPPTPAALRAPTLE